MKPRPAEASDLQNAKLVVSMTVSDTVKKGYTSRGPGFFVEAELTLSDGSKVPTQFSNVKKKDLPNTVENAKKALDAKAMTYSDQGFVVQHWGVGF